MRTRLAGPLLALLFGAAVPAAEKPPIIIHVGVTEYQDVEQTYRRYVDLFRELAEQAGSQPVAFEVAVGTYSEVQDWYNRRLIEVAVLSAMPAAELIESSSGQLDRIKQCYIGTLGEHAEPLASKQMALRSLFPQDDDLGVARKQYGADFYYRTTLVVLDDGANASPLRKASDLSDPKYRDRIKYIFVRPYSVSGYILPTHFLKQHGIDPRQVDYDYSYQHKYSLERLMNPLKEDQGKLLVAFAHDKTAYDPQATQRRFRRLEDTTNLDRSLIPYNAVIVNHTLDAEMRLKLKEVLSTLFHKRQARETRDFAFRLMVLDPAEWVREYDGVRAWLKEINLPRTLLYKSSLDEILEDLKEYRSSVGKPRLALVLSGGGAKCAYQVGAIGGIEKRLRQERERLQREGRKPEEFDDLDIGLVVGTSGGAINALAVALGITEEEKGRQALSETWESFRQRDFFQPSNFFNLIFGLSLGILQALFFTAASLLFCRASLKWRKLAAVLAGLGVLEMALALHGKATWGTALKFVAWQTAAILLVVGLMRVLRVFLGDWWRVAGWTMLVVATAQFLITRWVEPAFLLRIFPLNHWLHHAWSFLALIGLWSFPWPLLLGVAMVISGWRRVPHVHWKPALVNVMTLVVLATFAVLLWNVFFADESLSTGRGVKAAIVQRIPALMAARGVKVQSSPRESVDQQLEDLSLQILTNPSHLFKRDLVITASHLPMDERPLANTARAAGVPTPFVEVHSLPDDLYFYYRSNRDPDLAPPPQEKRFITFRRNPTKLFDVVLGSSTIYPFFPSQTLRNVELGEEAEWRGSIEKLRIVDGGFIHNSPIEAARTWGATHILLIEASPELPAREPNNFWQNTLFAFNYLFAQAQRLDTLSRGKVEIFQLRPSSDCDAREVRQNCNPQPRPNLDTFDFAPDLVSNAIEIGQSDVLGDTASTHPRPMFRRVPGPPAFRGISLEESAPPSAAGRFPRH
jgi:predicted acylesterase/phospholipase RssA/ABC-type phosphate/phosphonate transport system substrate-binding protein